MKNYIYNLLLLSSVLMISNAYAANMRCNGGIVSTEDTADEVLEKCGPPVSIVKDSPNVDDFGFIVRGAVFIEYWTYVPTGGMIYQLRFIDDRLVDIRNNR